MGPKTSYFFGIADHRNGLGRVCECAILQSLIQNGLQVEVQRIPWLFHGLVC